MTATTELSAYDREQLNDASLGHYDTGSGQSAGVTRYNFYRRKGYSVEDSVSFALNWLRNAKEQYDRRLAHETGAQGWRAIE